MPFILTEGPLAEPVSLPELKTQLRIDHDYEDTLLSCLLVAARIHVEQTWGLALITQSWSCFLDDWPDASDLHLPLFPIRAVRALRVYDPENRVTEVEPSSYAASVGLRSMRIVRGANFVWPGPVREANGVEIAIEAGFGASPGQTPEPIRQALLLLACQWYEVRELTASSGQFVVPQAVQALLSPYREFRL